MITNALIFVVLLFSPIVIPASNFPAWLLSADKVLPFYSMAELIKADLTQGLVTDLTRSYLIPGGLDCGGLGNDRLGSGTAEITTERAGRSATRACV